MTPRLSLFKKSGGKALFLTRTESQKVDLGLSVWLTTCENPFDEDL